MSLQLAHVEALVLAAPALKDLVLLVTHHMILILLVGGEVFERAGLYRAGPDLLCVLPYMPQE